MNRSTAYILFQYPICHIIGTLQLGGVYNTQTQAPISHLGYKIRVRSMRQLRDRNRVCSLRICCHIIIHNIFTWIYINYGLVSKVEEEGETLHSLRNLSLLQPCQTVIGPVFIKRVRSLSHFRSNSSQTRPGARKKIVRVDTFMRGGGLHLLVRGSSSINAVLGQAKRRRIFSIN